MRFSQSGSPLVFYIQISLCCGVCTCSPLVPGEFVPLTSFDFLEEAFGVSGQSNC